MNSKPGVRGLIRHPSAFVPVTMSLTAFAMVAIYLVVYSAERQSDEGIAAHIWELLLCAQMPLVCIFVIRWLPKAPQATLRVLALQLLALLVAIAPVYFLIL